MSGEMEMEQWLQVSSEPGREVSVFSIQDLKRLVSDAVRQKIPSLGAHYSVNLRFEDVRKYSSVQIRDPQGILYVPPPASVQPATVSALPPPDPELLASLVRKLTAVFAPSTLPTEATETKTSVLDTALQSALPVTRDDTTGTQGSVGLTSSVALLPPSNSAPVVAPESAPAIAFAASSEFVVTVGSVEQINNDFKVGDTFALPARESTETTSTKTSTHESVDTLPDSASTVPTARNEPMEESAVSSSTIPKPQQKKVKKRVHIPAPLEPFVQRSPARKRAAAQIASLQIRSLADSNRSPRPRVSFPAGLHQEPELLSSPIPQSIDLTVSTPASTVSSASVTSTTASTSLTARPQTSYVEKIHYVDAERVFGPQAAVSAIPQLPPPALSGPNPSKIWPEIDPKQMQSIVNDFKNRQRHEGMQFFDAAAWARLAPYAVQLHLHYCQSYAHSVREIASNTTWRIFVRFLPHLFRINGRRWATPIEQAVFNVARQMGEDLIPTSALVTRPLCIIGEATSFLASPENQLLPMDIWLQFAYSVDGVNDLSRTIRAIEGRSSTTIIARGFPNACTITTLMAQYTASVTDAPRVRTMWLHADLAIGGMYTVAKFAKEYGNQALNFEDVIIISMDIAMRCDAEISGEHFLNPVGLERYTNRAVYDDSEDAELLEWAVPTDLRARFDRCSTQQSVKIGHRELRIQSGNIVETDSAVSLNRGTLHWYYKSSRQTQNTLCGQVDADGSQFKHRRDSPAERQKN